MNKSQLIEELSKRVGNDKEEIRYILEELNNIILEKTRAGEKVSIQGFGVYKEINKLNIKGRLHREPTFSSSH